MPPISIRVWTAFVEYKELVIYVNGGG